MLDFFGLFQINTLYLILGILVLMLIFIIILIVVLCKQNQMMKKYRLFMEGKDGKSLEEQIDKKFKDIEEIKSKSIENSKDIAALMEKMEYTIQKVGVVKYDAFNEMGGKLSFALVMLNEDNTGFSINSMHGPEGSYSYIKEIIKGESYIALGEEEKQALAQALEK